MLRSKYIDRICCIMLVVMLLAATLLWGMAGTARGEVGHSVGYESSLFDASRVHTIDIEVRDWDAVIENAQSEEYVDCNVTVDGEKYYNVAIRAKGNTSLSSVASLGSTRYSFKIEFDHYVEGMSYHGLDKLSLNNLIQDATMMKDYLAYTLMNQMDVPSPLCSYVQISVNGEPWGLYLAVEGVEDGFLERNGMSGGELYKPDSMSFGGGRGNGRDFEMDQFRTGASDSKNPPANESPASPQGGFGGSSGAPGGDFSPSGGGSASGGTQMPDFGNSSGMPGGDFMPQQGESGVPAMPEAGQMPSDGSFPAMPDGGGFGGFNFGMGNDDVKLIYSDDNPDSYPNIFDNAKTKLTKRDKQRLIEALRKLNNQEDIDSTVDTDEVIRYLAVHNFLCNDDSYTGMMVHNYYLYEENGQLSIIPWDYNLAFGGFSASTNATSTVNSAIDSPVSGGTVESRPLIAWIFSDEASLEHYHEIYDAFITENIESGWLEAEIARVQEMITPYLETDESKFYDMEEFEKAVDTLQTFCARRCESIRGQLEGSIASSTQARQENSANLVDASDISTEDMGCMNSNQGGGFPQSGPGQATTPGQTADPGQATRPGQTGDSEQAAAPGSSGGPGRPQGDFAGSQGSGATDAGETAAEPQTPAAPRGGSRPEGFPDGAGQNQQLQWLSLGVWALVLLAGLAVVKRVSSHN